MATASRAELISHGNIASTSARSSTAREKAGRRRARTVNCQPKTCRAAFIARLLACPGRGAAQAGGVKPLLRVGRIRGCALTKAADPKLCVVELQYTDPTGAECSIEMGLPDALYLLNLLEAMSRDEGYDHLRRDPRRN